MEVISWKESGERKGVANRRTLISGACDRSELEDRYISWASIEFVETGMNLCLILPSNGMDRCR